MMSSPPLGRMRPQRRDGTEAFELSGQTQEFNVHEYWAWAVSDLVSNATRGVLAEYIVAKACNIDTSQPRDEWAAVDLLTPDGVSVEVKSAAYIQAWYQDRFSEISFGVRKTLKWDPDTNQRSGEPHRAADVYVFALLAHKDQETLDPLNLDQWDFYVLPTAVLDARERSQHSITLPSLKRLKAGPHQYTELHSAVLNAAKEHRDAKGIHS